MSSIVEVLMSAAGGAAVQQLGRQFGLSEGQTGSALSQLVPALMAGLQHNASQEGGMGALLGALGSGNHSRYLEDPDLLGADDTRNDGNSILGHIFGSKDVSRSVANSAAQQTGISADILKKMLPLVATMVMGGLSKQNAAAPASGLAGGASILGALLDQNRSGSVADEVVGLLGRFLGGR
jgi:hypothetical protein